MKKDSWLYSDSFLKRALAIWGYNFVGGLIVGVPIVIIMLILMSMFAITASRSFMNIDNPERGLQIQFQE